MSSRFRNKRRSYTRKPARTYNRRKIFKNTRTRKMRGGTSLENLMTAIDWYNIDNVKKILTGKMKTMLGYNIPPPDINGIENDMTPLIKALTKNPFNKDKQKNNIIKQIINLLIESGADVNKRATEESIDGTTPLMMAIISNYDSEIINLLIEKGADVNAKNENDDTPLIIAIKVERRVDIIELLIEKGADVNAKNNDSVTPLLLAIENKKYSSVIELLIKNGANIDNLNEKQKRRLEEASEEGDEEMVAVQL